MVKIVLLTRRAAIGLGGHQSKKKSIWLFLNFSRWLLKEFMLGVSTASWERLFHLFMLRWEKTVRDFWLVVWLRQLPAVTTSTVGNSRPTEKLCPRNSWKTLDHLESSIRSALFRRSSSDHNPSLLSLSLYGNCLRSLNILVNRCWTLSNKTFSLT